MAHPFYVSPEQMMKDRAEYARKGIARGRSLVALEFDNGVVFVTQNPSRSLYKTSEIYDRIAYAAVGKYNEFEALRVSGIRLADIKGYQYARRDVTAKSLANAYSQALGNIFIGENKPYEVEVLIAQVGERGGERVGGPGPRNETGRAHPEETAGEANSQNRSPIELYHILYDGSIVDEHRYVAIGGDADDLAGMLESRYEEGLTLDEAVAVGVGALAERSGEEIPADNLEVSGLDAHRRRRKFFRLHQDQLTRILGGS